MDAQTELGIVRAAYAKQVLAAAGVNDSRLAQAFAAIPREDFLGPGPWLVRRWLGNYVSTPDADPVYLYTDDLVALVPERRVNNGQPSLHAHLIHQALPAAGQHVVHVGTGTGYYTAILAHLVGPSGRVTGIEFDEGLAARAKANLAPYANVAVIKGDGTQAQLMAASPRRPGPIWHPMRMSPSSRATARRCRSMSPMSSMSMPAARGQRHAGSMALPTAAA